MAGNSVDHVVKDVATVAVAVSAGALCGSLLNGFGHLRNIYSNNPKRKARELKKLERENVERLKARLVIGSVLGACAGIALGMLLASPARPQAQVADEDS